ncbi:hypothetical protein [Caniella muris]|uniref:hypothetical protein n=1 Tax=Caniella muris TaxID=2941502 RepID=UPI00203C1219|nr:hypothetical protein [Caniella muris]
MGAARAAVTAASITVAAGAPWAGVALASTGDVARGVLVGSAPIAALAAVAAASALRRRAAGAAAAAPAPAPAGGRARYRGPGARSVAVAVAVRGRTLTLTADDGEVTGIPVCLATAAPGSCVVDLDVCGRLVFDDPEAAARIIEEMIP